MAPPIPPPPPPPSPTPPNGLNPTDLIPVWMDVRTAQFLVGAITAALEGQNQPKTNK
jgi:hypothetical protein